MAFIVAKPKDQVIKKLKEERKDNQMKHDEIRLDDLKAEKAEVDVKLLDLDNFLFEHRGGLEYEEKRLLRVQRTIMYSYSTVLGERITALKETIRKYYEN